MTDSLLELAYRLMQAGEPFVLATVIWCERPTSAKPGAQAIITANGQITGWIGGSCAQPVVLREALRILREGDDPYLLRLGSPDAGMGRSGDVRVFPMSCTSGGVLDIYMEPHLPQPQLLLIGDSPVIAALSRLAPVLNFTVTQFESPDLSQVHIDDRTFILVATHGQYDEDALESALRSPASYVGMVGSRRRGEAIRDYLHTSGLAEHQIARLRVPAGLDLGAVTPEEIAASIIAELVQVKRRGTTAHKNDSNSSTQDQTQKDTGGELLMNSERSGATFVGATFMAPLGRGEATVPDFSTSIQESENTGDSIPETALDPVCGMIVEIASARHRSTYDGRDFYFCCPACKRLFERNPHEYLVHDER